MTSYPGLSNREFLGEEFFKMCVTEYQNARLYLKHCGKPKDDFDRWLIQDARWAAAFWVKFLD